ncbi:MAG: histidine kinase [Egibacteraceae bacterium]
MGWVLTALAFLGAAFGLYVAREYGQEGAPVQWLAWGLLSVGWIYIGAGLVAWRRRPANRLGPLLTAAGFAWFLPGLRATGVPILFALGFWLSQLHRTIVIHLVIAFPSGRLSSRWERLVVGAGYSLGAIGGFMLVVTYDPSAYPSEYSSLYLPCSSCATAATPTANALLLYSNRFVFEALARVLQGAVAVLAVVILGMVVARWRVSSGPTRRALTPVWLSTFVFAAGAAYGTGAAAGVLSEPANEVLRWVSGVGRLAVPIAFLLELLRMRMARAGVGELVVELDQTPPRNKLREVLARVLRDPSLEVVFWLADAECYVDSEGRAVRLPGEGSGRAVTLVQGEGRPLAAMIHDPALADERELVEAVAAAARLGLENDRLHAEVAAQLAEMRASRARIVEVSDAERRKVERDLHDGAQQRLVTLALSLRLAQMHLLPDADPKLRAALAAASEELQRALSELRQLAQGIHPAILTQQGLGAAVGSLAEQAPLPVEVAVPGRRYPAPVETTAYFVICEALTNITKYAQASMARVAIEQADGRLTVEVVDDGVGGADPARGSGLSGLADRVAALEGQLRVESPPGEGTRVRAELPCG